MPATDARFTITEPCRVDLPLSASAGAHSLVPSHTPVMLMATRRFQSSMVASIRSLPRNTPALFTRISSLANFLVVAVTAAVHDPSVVTSRVRASALPPASAISLAVSRARSASTSPMTTVAPAAAILRAVSAPIPRAAPDKSATFPSNRFMSALLQAFPERLWDHDDSTRYRQRHRGGTGEAAM